jgi:hypothetical protein
MAETISYIKAGNQNHPIDAVTVNGLTLTSEEKSAWNNKQDALTFDSKPTKNSTNPVTSAGVYTAISAFVSSAYLSTNYYNKTEVSQEIANALTGAFVVVSGTELPTPTHDTLGKIYLLSADNDNPSGQGPEDLKLEYITIWDQILYGYRWEQIGTTRIDLTDYVTTSALSTKLSSYVTTSALSTKLSSYATTSAMTSALSGKQNTITDLASIRSGASKGATAYQKPSTGIPASDIAAGVIPSLAGYATESYVDQEVSVAVSVKQDKLVSGTNIKTINSESLLGSGDLVITQEQADWNQNDNTAVDYVKNRTHYVETSTFENVSFDMRVGAVWFQEDIITTCSGTLDGNSVTIFSWRSHDDYYYNSTPQEFEYPIIIKKSGTSMIVNGVEVPDVFDSQNTVIKSSVNVGDIPVEVGVHKLDGKYLDLKTINGESLKGSGDLVTKSVYVGTCPTAAGTANKVVTVEEFPLVNGAPVVGTTIVVKFTYTNTAANAKLVVNGTSAASIWFNTAAYTATGNVAGAAGRYSTYTWDGTYWVWVSHGTDNNDNTLAYQVRYNSASMTASDAFVRYRLLFTSVDNNHWVPGTTGTSTNATSARNVNTTPINPLGQIVFYNSTAAVTAAGTPGATTLYTQMNVTLGYTFNKTGTVALTTKVPVYVKCAPQATGGAVIDPDTPCVQTLPSTEDGKLYIYLGIASSATAVEITPYHPVFYYKDGQIRLWTNAAESGGALIIDAVIAAGETGITVPSGTFAAIGDALDAGKMVYVRLTDENQEDLEGPAFYHLASSITDFAYIFYSDGTNGTSVLGITYSDTCQQDFYVTGNMIDITWAKLVNKRGKSELTPGTWYRITDYATTTTQTDTQSAGNSFDVVVLATSANTLNENARAIWNTDVQDYFKQAGAKLDAWELKYCLDNDKSRFSWAKEMTISLGNTTYTRDRTRDTSHNLTKYYAWSGNSSALRYTTNEVPEAGDHTYDDTFAEDADITAVSADGRGVIYYMKDEWGNECPYDFKNIQFKRSSQWFSQHSAWATNILGSTPSNDMYFYTFSWYNANMEIEDASVIGYKLKGDEEGAHYGVYDNKIGALNAYYNGGYGQQLMFSLNSIVFISSDAYDGGIFYGCQSNTFGDDCHSNTFGNGCHNNTFGNGCLNNTFGNDCHSNTFGNNCSSNTFGNDCSYNTFGNSCQSNTFGNSCSYNTFGSGCNYNTFGNSCSANTFGNDCTRIKTGNSSTIRNYYQNIIVDNGNRYIYLYCSQATTSSSKKYINVHIYSGVNNTTTWKTITDANVNQTFLTEYKPANSLVISV